MAGEKHEDEAEKFNYEKGAYLYKTLHNRMNKTDLIKDIFLEMMHNENADAMKPCVEWYKNDDECYE